MVGVIKIIIKLVIYVMIFNFGSWLFDLDKNQVTITEYIALRLNGIKTQGVVTDKWVIRSHQNAFDYLRYSFQEVNKSDNNKIISKAFAKPSEEASLDVKGSDIDILYFEKNPQINAPLRFVDSYGQYSLRPILILAFFSWIIWFNIIDILFERSDITNIFK